MCQGGEQVAIGRREEGSVPEQEGKEQIVDRLTSTSSHLAWDIHEGVEIIVDDVLSSQREDLTVSISLVAVLLIRKLAVLELTIRGNLLETARTKQSIARNLLKVAYGPDAAQIKSQRSALTRKRPRASCS